MACTFLKSVGLTILLREPFLTCLASILFKISAFEGCSFPATTPICTAPFVLDILELIGTVIPLSNAHLLVVPVDIGVKSIVIEAIVLN
jgi:hypothetical protein